MTYDNQWDESFTDEDENDARQNAPGPKDLRKQLKSMGDELKTLRAERDELRAKDRRTSLTKVVKDAGLSEKVAAFYPADADPAPDAVSKWLADHKDIFAAHRTDDASAPDDEGKETNEVPDGPPASTVPESVKDLYELLAHEGIVAPPGASDTHTKLMQAESPEEIYAILEAGK